MKRATLLRLALGLLFLTTLPSCGFAFRKAWNEPTPCALMMSDPAGAAKISPVAGKWSGTWHSDATGHHGTLRCVVSRPVDQKGGHEFFYQATWKKILSGSYKSVHTVRKQKDGTCTFKGEHKMPDWAGGLYHYQGTIKGDDFSACYQSAMDHGTYTMKRVP